MSPSTDPLLLLRSALSSSVTILLLSLPTPTSSPVQVYSLSASTHISLPSPTSSAPVLLPKSTPTRYLTAASTSSFYDLQTLLFAYLQKDAPVAEYLKKASEEGVGFVSLTERRAVVEWLEGKGDEDGPAGKIVGLVGAGGGKREREEEQVKERTAERNDGKLGRDAAVVTGPGAAGVVQEKKARYVVDKDDQDTVKAMIALMDGPPRAKGGSMGGATKNKDTALRGERVNNFDSARALVVPRLKLLKEKDELLRANSKSGAAAASTTTGGGVVLGKQKKKPRDPIIIISPSSTALITMHNVKRFLEDSIFETSEAARLSSLSNSNPNKQIAEDVIVVNHARMTSKLNSSVAASEATEVRKVRYFIVDSVEALSKFGGLEDAWERVVCVMTTGQEWQFRPYKWTDPKDLFQHVKGIHVQWSSDPPNPKVRGWNVTELRIDAVKRHIDKSTVAEFWRGLEGWIALNKSWLSQ